MVRNQSSQNTRHEHTEKKLLCTGQTTKKSESFKALQNSLPSANKKKTFGVASVALCNIYFLSPNIQALRQHELNILTSNTDR